MQELELPLASGLRIQHVSSEFYYQIPVRPTPKSYPIYAPGKEPPGYWDWLRKQEPQPAFDPASLKTEQDWVRAGELVFAAPHSFTAFDNPFTDVRNPQWYEFTGIQLDKNGVLPYYRYVIREKGRVEVNFDSCAQCHTRVMADGTVLPGAQGNVPFGRMWAYRLAHDKSMDPTQSAQSLSWRFFGAPWMAPDPTAPLSQGTMADFIRHVSTIPEGVNVRMGTSALYPAQIPDLIGLKDRLYLDHTGLQQHRSIADLMRYDAINNFIPEIAGYNGYHPVTGSETLPEPKNLSRYGDLELYALAQFLYSLQPPSNPHRFDTTAAEGKQVFERQGCSGCHTPPLYTNNKLTPVTGFSAPKQDHTRFRILNVVVGTDPFLATKTRRGTGYYKVPSLRGVWYRGPFEHNGSVATLEDWFDARRLRDNYVPTGYRGYGTSVRAVKGHPFGLNLAEREKRALIAFLKTL